MSEPGMARKPNPHDFESVAKRLECDEDKDWFEATLGELAKAKAQ